MGCTVEGVGQSDDIAAARCFFKGLVPVARVCRMLWALAKSKLGLIIQCLPKLKYLRLWRCNGMSLVCIDFGHHLGSRS